MRSGSQWKHLGQLGRAFTVNHFHPVRYKENLIKSTFFSWSKTVEQLWKSNTILLSGLDLGNRHIAEDAHLSSRGGHGRRFRCTSCHEFVGQSPVPTSKSGYTGPISRKYCPLNLSQYGRLGFKLTPARTQVSSAASSEPDYWDTSDSTIASELSHESSLVDQNRVLREREWDHDDDEGQKVRKDFDGMKMSSDVDGDEWGQEHLGVHEDETRQRASHSTNSPPKFHHDDVYIPVKACYISRSMDLKRLSEEPFLEITPSRNNIIIRFTNRPADAKPTSNRPVQFSILDLQK